MAQLSEADFVADRLADAGDTFTLLDEEHERMAKKVGSLQRAAMDHEGAAWRRTHRDWVYDRVNYQAWRQAMAAWDAAQLEIAPLRLALATLRQQRAMAWQELRKWRVEWKLLEARGKKRARGKIAEGRQKALW